jgi:opacity protein-like surface antigen
LESQPNNIDNAIRQKFDNFAPPPPEHIWEGVAAGIATPTKPLVTITLLRGVGIAATVLLLISLGFWWFLPTDDEVVITGSTEETIAADNQQTPEETIMEENQAVSTDAALLPADDKIAASDILEQESSQQQDASDLVSNTKQQAVVAAQVAVAVEDDPEETEADMTFGDKTGHATFYGMAPYGAEIENDLPRVTLSKAVFDPVLAADAMKPEPVKGWSHGIYFTPEAMLNDFDSVTILPSYSLNYEPSYHFNKHLFMRFGIGVQYTRDRGFANVDFTRNEVVGNYEDVYEVTFDSIDGAVIPTYHTQTVDIWDSVRHIQVSELTNNYLYVQVPLLLGYHNKNNRVNWFFYGGPAINMMVSKSIDEPTAGLENASISMVENRLPERSPYYFQMWFGAGIEYKFADQLALALEPNYRYYFDHVYEDEQYQRGLSSFSLRVGIVYKVK